MRKHEILAAIVEMRFVNCKLCNKAGAVKIWTC